MIRRGFLSGYPIPRKKNPPAISGFSGFCTRDFFGIFWGFKISTKHIAKTELAFCRDIPSHEKIPILGIKNPRFIPKIKIPESRGFRINSGDFSYIPGISYILGIKIPRLETTQFWIIKFHNLKYQIPTAWELIKYQILTSLAK